MRGFLRIVGLGSLAFSLAACEYGSADAVRPLSVAAATSSYVSDIDVSVVTEEAPQSLAGTLETELRKELDGCATGSVPVRLEAFVTQYEGPDAVRALLIGHGLGMRGSAQIYASNGDLIGDYDVARSLGGGGIIPTVVMENGEEILSNAFAREICEEVFGE